MWLILFLLFLIFVIIFRFIHSLIFGIGFPPFFGGALHYADLLGLDKVCAMADKYSHLGKLYEPTAKMREMAASGATYYNK